MLFFVSNTITGNTARESTGNTIGNTTGNTIGNTIPRIINVSAYAGYMADCEPSETGFIGFRSCPRRNDYTINDNDWLKFYLSTNIPMHSCWISSLHDRYGKTNKPTALITPKIIMHKITSTYFYVSIYSNDGVQLLFNQNPINPYEYFPLLQQSILKPGSKSWDTIEFECISADSQGQITLPVISYKKSRSNHGGWLSLFCPENGNNRADCGK